MPRGVRGGGGGERENIENIESLYLEMELTSTDVNHTFLFRIMEPVFVKMLSTCTVLKCL